MIDWLEKLLEAAAGADLAMLALAIGLHLASQYIRQGGWKEILEFTFQTPVGLRDVALCSFAGGWLSAFLPKGGHVLKMLLLKNRIKGSCNLTIAGTYVPETLFEVLMGLGLGIWVVTVVDIPLPLPQLPGGALVAPLVAVSLIGIGLFRFRAWIRAQLMKLVRGFAILRKPGYMLGNVLPWQLAGRVVRLLSLMAFLSAFHLPSGLMAAVMVMGVYGISGIVPFSAANAGIRIPALVMAFAYVGNPVVSSSVAAFVLAESMIVMFVNTVVGMALFAFIFKLRSPRQAVRMARHMARGGKMPVPQHA